MEGRWINRDPIEEKGTRVIAVNRHQITKQELSLYMFVENKYTMIDFLGLKLLSDKEACNQVLSSRNINEDGLLICYRGRPIPCVKPEEPRDTDFPMITSCIQRHEEVHAIMFSGRCDPNKCDPYAPNYKNQGDKNSNECFARAAEFLCLLHAMKMQCGVSYAPRLIPVPLDAPFCVFRYQRAISSALANMINYCNNFDSTEPLKQKSSCSQ